MEIRTESTNKKFSLMGQHFHGLNRLVTSMNNKDQDDNEQETSEMQFEEDALKSNVLTFASRSKAEAANSTPRTSHFLVVMTRTRVAQVVSLACAPHISQSSHASSPCAHVVCLILRDFSTFLFLLSIFSPVVLSSWPSTSSSTMWRTNTLCTLANEDFGTLAEYNLLTVF